MKSKKNCPLASRIKRLMQSDDDVGKIAQATPVLISRAMELFLKKLCDSMVATALARQAKSVTSSHLKNFISTDPQMDFLAETVAQVPDLQGEAAMEAQQPSKKRRISDSEPVHPASRPRASTADVNSSTQRETDLRAMQLGPITPGHLSIRSSAKPGAHPAPVRALAGQHNSSHLPDLRSPGQATPSGSKPDSGGLREGRELATPGTRPMLNLETAYKGATMGGPSTSSRGQSAVKLEQENWGLGHSGLAPHHRNGKLPPATSTPPASALKIALDLGDADLPVLPELKYFMKAESTGASFGTITRPSGSLLSSSTKATVEQPLTFTSPMRLPSSAFGGILLDLNQPPPAHLTGMTCFNAFPAPAHIPGSVLGQLVKVSDAASQASKLLGNFPSSTSLLEPLTIPSGSIVSAAKSPLALGAYDSSVCLSCPVPVSSTASLANSAAVRRQLPLSADAPPTSALASSAPLPPALPPPGQDVPSAGFHSAASQHVSVPHWTLAQPDSNGLENDARHVQFGLGARSSDIGVLTIAPLHTEPLLQSRVSTEPSFKLYAIPSPGKGSKNVGETSCTASIFSRDCKDQFEFSVKQQQLATESSNLCFNSSLAKVSSPPQVSNLPDVLAIEDGNGCSAQGASFQAPPSQLPNPSTSRQESPTSPCTDVRVPVEPVIAPHTITANAGPQESPAAAAHTAPAAAIGTEPRAAGAAATHAEPQTSPPPTVRKLQVPARATGIEPQMSAAGTCPKLSVPAESAAPSVTARNELSGAASASTSELTLPATFVGTESSAPNIALATELPNPAASVAPATLSGNSSIPHGHPDPTLSMSTSQVPKIASAFADLRAEPRADEGQLSAGHSSAPHFVVPPVLSTAAEMLAEQMPASSSSSLGSTVPRQERVILATEKRVQAVALMPPSSAIRPFLAPLNSIGSAVYDDDYDA